MVQLPVSWQMDCSVGHQMTLSWAVVDVSSFVAFRRVAKFPPCFRCGLVAECCCANNDMLQEQIANWLSFRKAWKVTQMWCLIC